MRVSFWERGLFYHIDGFFSFLSHFPSFLALSFKIKFDFIMLFYY